MRPLSHNQAWKAALLVLGLASWLSLPVSADEKGGMPDLSQQDQTCLPTSTANLIVWFGKHGYPKLIVDGDGEDDGYIHTVHRIMTATGARYDYGTRTDAIAYGIHKYITEAGYDCDVEYRGVDWNQVKMPDVVADPDGEKYKEYSKTAGAFNPDWLKENDDPNKGFILLLAYIKYNRGANLFTSAINAGHAVTLVNAEPDTILIHDPAHEDDEPGRKILTPEVLTGGVFRLPGYDAPVNGLMLLSGSLLEAPPESDVLLTGAVCITMHPASTSPGLVTTSGGATSTVGASSSGPDTNAPSATPPAPPAPAAPASESSSSWVMWLFDLFFKK